MVFPGIDAHAFLLKDFSQITNPTFSAPAPIHGIYHHIPTHGRTVWSHPCNLFPEKLLIAKLEFAHLQELGIICPSHSEWASPLHMAPTGNGKWRPCGDYWQLNLALVPDSYLIPHIQDFAAGSGGSYNLYEGRFDPWESSGPCAAESCT